jgi:eukaryotic-like serine/threonine-protein kinase
MSEQPPPRDPAEDETVISPDWGVEEEAYVERRDTLVEPPPPARRPPTIWPWLLALLVLVVGGLIALWLLTRDDDEEAATTTTVAELSVPEVVGSQESDARDALRAAGFEARVVKVPSDEPEGIVVAQDPAGGSTEPEGSEVRLNVAEAAPAPTTSRPTTTAEDEEEEEPPATTGTTTATPPPLQPGTVPDAVGGELADGVRAFGDKGLKVAVQYVPSQERRGTVVAQAQPPGTEKQQGDTVQVNVSEGPEPPPAAQVPDVAGETLDDARGRLDDAGFEVIAVELPVGRAGVVGSQSPGGGASIPRGSLVVLYVGD